MIVQLAHDLRGNEGPIDIFYKTQRKLVLDIACVPRYNDIKIKDTLWMMTINLNLKEIVYHGERSH